MQIPQYERRPKEIPTYKPLQENWRFANPYPASIEVGKAPTGEALGAIGRGLSDAWGRLQKMEDESYFQVMMPKTLIKSQQLLEDYILHANREDTEYIAKGVSYVENGIEQFLDKGDSGFDPKKSEINKKMLEIRYSHVIVPSISRLGELHASAMVAKGQRDTELANNYYIEGASMNRKSTFYDAMGVDGPAIRGITSVNPFSTTTGTTLEALKPALTSTVKSFNDGLLTADKLESTKESVIRSAIVAPHDDNIMFVKKDIDHIQGLDYTKQTNVDSAHSIIARDRKVIKDSIDQLQNSTILVIRNSDGSYDGEVLYKMDADQIAARIHYHKTKDPSNPVQVEVVTKENLDLAVYNKTLDNYNNMLGQLDTYEGRIRLIQKNTKAGAGHLEVNTDDVPTRIDKAGAGVAVGTPEQKKFNEQKKVLSGLGL